MTRVLIVEPSGQLWGSERSLLGLLDGRPRMDLAVCCPPGTPLVSELDKRGIRIFPFFISGLHEKNRINRLWAAFGVLRACLAFKPDVLHLNQSGAFRVVLPAARLVGVKIIAHTRLFEDAAYLASCKPNPRSLVGIVAISDAIEGELRSRPELKEVTIHCAYDGFAINASVSTEVKFENRICCVGRIIPIKGQRLLIAAMKGDELRSRKVECLIIGDGPDDYLAELQSEAQGNITWTGFVREPIRLVQRCSVLVCPSYREPLGRVVLEAWCVGAIPVVFAGSGGAAEIVEAADGGILYQEQTVESLERAILTALSLESSERERLITNGRTWVSKNCDPLLYASRFSEIVDSVAALQ